MHKPGASCRSPSQELRSDHRWIRQRRRSLCASALTFHTGKKVKANTLPCCPITAMLVDGEAVEGAPQWC